MAKCNAGDKEASGERKAAFHSAETFAELGHYQRSNLTLVFLFLLLSSFLFSSFFSSFWILPFTPLGYLFLVLLWLSLSSASCLSLLVLISASVFYSLSLSLSVGLSLVKKDNHSLHQLFAYYCLFILFRLVL